MLKNKFIVFILFVLVVGGVVGGYGVYRYNKRIQYRKLLDEEAKKKKKPETRITIVEGSTLDRIKTQLQSLGTLTAEQVNESINEVPFPKINSSKKITSHEGFVFPDTYNLFVPVKPADLIIKSYSLFEKKFTQASEGVKVLNGKFVLSDFGDYMIDPYDVVVLASILERESGVDLSKVSANDSKRLTEERQLVAGVFYNRLIKGMHLESDATVNYATKKSLASVTYKDLEIDSPYNSYKYPGLPPTPISNPSYSSLYAALHPKKSDFFFFLHKQPSGEIVFSKTYDEHLRNQNRFLR